MGNDHAVARVTPATLFSLASWTLYPKGDMGSFLATERGMGEFHDLGISEFFICPYDRARNRFEPPEKRLMAIREDEKVNAYLRDTEFREVRSTLRSVIHSYLETVLLHLMLCQPPSRRTRLSLAELETQLCEVVLSKNAGVWEDMPGGGLEALLKGLSPGLSQTFGMDMLTVREGLCSLERTHGGLSSYVSFRVVKPYERMAAVVWDSFVSHVTSEFDLFREQEDGQFAADAEGWIYSEMRDDIRGCRLWREMPDEKEWARTWQTLFQAMPTQLCGGRLTECGICEEPADLDGTINNLLRAWFEWTGPHTERHDLEQALADLNAHVVARLPARAAAVRATGWPRLLVYPAIVDGYLLGAFFASVESEQKLRRPKSIQTLLALVEAIAGPTLQQQRLQAEMRVTGQLVSIWSHALYSDEARIWDTASSLYEAVNSPEFSSEAVPLLEALMGTATHCALVVGNDIRCLRAVRSVEKGNQQVIEEMSFSDGKRSRRFVTVDDIVVDALKEGFLRLVWSSDWETFPDEDIRRYLDEWKGSRNEHLRRLLAMLSKVRPRCMHDLYTLVPDPIRGIRSLGIEAKPELAASDVTLPAEVCAGGVNEYRPGIGFTVLKTVCVEYVWNALKQCRYASGQEKQLSIETRTLEDFLTIDFTNSADVADISYRGRRVSEEQDHGSKKGLFTNYVLLESFFPGFQYLSETPRDGATFSIRLRLPLRHFCKGETP